MAEVRKRMLAAVPFKKLPPRPVPKQKKRA